MSKVHLDALETIEKHLFSNEEVHWQELNRCLSTLKKLVSNEPLRFEEGKKGMAKLFNVA